MAGVTDGKIQHRDRKQEADKKVLVLCRRTIANPTEMSRMEALQTMQQSADQRKGEAFRCNVEAKHIDCRKK
uniref:Uncharacterized protein n=1 Tax=Panagrellus redivivus TaxID=6233 RepID=A0A7E4WA55_PANRE